MLTQRAFFSKIAEILILRFRIRSGVISMTIERIKILKESEASIVMEAE
jgi:hypothetical protein